MTAEELRECTRKLDQQPLVTSAEYERAQISYLCNITHALIELLARAEKKGGKQ